ncbi:hypothetical protein [uncultured Sphaerochaeta sp.]|uniref:hypothetical protein n=1 Tax=uncultured Sphaerochaeta sp. TaxID=886478 RepID=UPI002A0A445C|nr:hypothetical protein [uncultured Sphaerochaeta sp.]
MQEGSRHSSTPTFPTSLGKISKAISRIEAKRHKAVFTQPVKKMLENIGKESPFFSLSSFESLAYQATTHPDIFKSPYPQCGNENNQRSPP